MNRKPQIGQSLIELMIAMTLGLLLLSFFITIFQSIRGTSSYTNNLIATQEVGRTLFQLLQRDFYFKNIKILNPDLIPIEIKTKVLKNTEALFLQLNKEKVIYYLTATRRKDNYGKSIVELERRDLSINRHNQTAMLDGAEDLQFEYGALYQGHLNFYKAVDITDWSKIKAIQVKFKVRIENMTKPFQFALGEG